MILHGNDVGCIQTEFMRKKLEEENWDTKLGVWGRGVDPELFSPGRRCEDLRRQLGVGPNDLAVLWLGRVVQEKHPGVWLQVSLTHSCIECASLVDLDKYVSTRNAHVSLARQYPCTASAVL